MDCVRPWWHLATVHRAPRAGGAGARDPGRHIPYTVTLTERGELDPAPSPWAGPAKSWMTVFEEQRSRLY